MPTSDSEMSSFEEVTFSGAGQLLADPLSESTRKRQSLLLLLSVASLAVFYGIIAPEKLSFAGIDLKILGPLAASGKPSTRLMATAINALAFDRVLCPVLIYAAFAFSLSVYRDHIAANYARGLAAYEIGRVVLQTVEISTANSKELKVVLQEFQKANDANHERYVSMQKELDKTFEEFKRNLEPIRAAHASAVEKFEQLRREGAPRNSELENRMLGLGWQMSELSKKHDEVLMGYSNDMDKIQGDQSMKELNRKLDELTEESFRLSKEHRLRTRILADLNSKVRLWKRLWNVLEVAFPLLFGVVAILVPIWALIS